MPHFHHDAVDAVDAVDVVSTVNTNYLYPLTTATGISKFVSSLGKFILSYEFCCHYSMSYCTVEDRNPGDPHQSKHRRLPYCTVTEF